MILNKIVKATAFPDREFDDKIFDQINESFIGAMQRNASPKSTVRQFKDYLDKFDELWFDAKIRDTGSLRQRSKNIFIRSFRDKYYESLVKIATGYSVKYGHRLHFTKDAFKKAVSAQCAMQFARYGNVYTFEIFAFAMRILIKYFKIYELAAVEYNWLFDADSLSDCLNTILDFDDVNWDAYMEFLEMKDVMEEARRQAKMQPIKKLKPEKREDILQYVDYSLTKKENLERIREAFKYSSIKYVYKKLEDFNIDKDTLQPITSVNYEQQIQALRANLEYERSAKNKIIKEKDKEIERLNKIIKDKDEEIERLKNILKRNNISI